MSYVGFEPTITASERAKTVHALDRSTNVIGKKSSLHHLIPFLQFFQSPSTVI
jgi:FAD synthase